MKTDLDLRDVDVLNGLLLQIFAFVEEVNATVADWVRGKSTHRPSLQGAVVQVAQHYLRPDAKWRLQPALLGYLDRVNISPPPLTPATVERLVARILSPLAVTVEGQTVKVVKSGSEPFAALQVSRMTDGFRGYDVDHSIEFATRPVRFRESLLSKSKVRHCYLDPPLEPFDAIRDFLNVELRIQSARVDYHCQRWIRRTFRIHYDNDLSYALSSVCARLNEIFYDAAIPSQHLLHTTRPNTLSLGLLLDEIGAAVAPRRSSGAVSVDTTAVGILTFLRLNRLLRSRFHWLEPKAQKDLVAGHDGIDEVPSAPGDLQTCLTALQPLHYSFVKTRIFGTTTGITGLDFVFRGGLLPYTTRGRTLVLKGPAGSGKTVLALNILAELAVKGGIGIYVSLEESRGALVDRLVTFGLYDPAAYAVVQSGDRLQHDIAAAVAARKGVVVLFGSAEHAANPFDLVEAIRQLGKDLAKFNLPRAIVIDSVNALTVHNDALEVSNVGRPNPLVTAPLSPPGTVPPSPARDAIEAKRASGRILVDAIERGGFIGIILSEAGAGRTWASIAYLADTVIELGLDQGHRNRWIEVMKCRAQNYHQGRHPFRLLEGRGVVVYPSLAAIRSTLRLRGRNVLSEQRAIPLPPPLAKGLRVPDISEKSCTLVIGASGSGKTLFGLTLVTEPARFGEHAAEGPAEKLADVTAPEIARPDPPSPPSHVLIVTFRTPVVRFNQVLAHHPYLVRRWRGIRKPQVRWYSPGEDISGDQVLNEIWRFIRVARREGLPLERILFDEVEVADELLPGVTRSELFWPTLFELLATEPITTFILTRSGDSRLIDTLKTSADYVFSLDASTSTHRITVEKRAGTFMLQDQAYADVVITPEGEFR